MNVATIKALANEERDRLIREAAPEMYKALDEIYMLTAYIVTHYRGARMTANIENGPHVVAPSLEEVGQILLKIGTIARAAIALAEGRAPEAEKGQPPVST